MKVYVSHSPEMDFVEYLYQPIQQSGLTKEAEFVFPKEASKKIDGPDVQPDLILAEISIPSRELVADLAYAIEKGIPIVGLHLDGVEPDENLKALIEELYAYEDIEDMIDMIAFSFLDKNL